MRIILRVATALVVLQALSAEGAQPITGDPTANVCSETGMLGFRFGQRLPAGSAIPASGEFGPSCYRFVPENPNPYFDRYAVCASEFGTGIYEIQASKTFDVTPAPGSDSLTPAQVQANRSLGRKVLEGVLADLSPSVAAKADVDWEGRTLTAAVAQGVLLELNNGISWEVSLSCKDVARTQDVYRRRLEALRN